MQKQDTPLVSLQKANCLNQICDPVPEQHSFQDKNSQNISKRKMEDMQ
jgi:hypothetical protein